jgi:hypothetical protein
MTVTAPETPSWRVSHCPDLLTLYVETSSTALDQTYRERAEAGALLKRAADKDDVANQVVAFCQTDSITGQTLVVDAGRFLHEELIAAQFTEKRRLPRA